MASMLELIERHPHAAAITGQPRLPPVARLPFAEKLNVVANLMDVVPAVPPRPSSCRWASRRAAATCSGSRRCAAWASTTRACVSRARTRCWRRSCAAQRIRDLPGAAARVPPLRLGRAGQHRKLLRHQRLFGRTTPYIVLAVPGSLAGLVGRHAGANRSRRTLLRATQLASSAAYALVAASCLAGWPVWLWGECAGLRRRRQGRPLRGRTRGPCASLSGSSAAFVLLQPALDLAFTAGVLEGFWQLARGRARPID